MKKNPIEAKVEIRKAMMKLRARVYYDSARPGLGAVKDFRPIIDAFVTVMNKWGNKEDKDIKNDLQGFCDFLECLVGYHYVYAEK
jgi:CRISPR type III-A-associated protein Csm2